MEKLAPVWFLAMLAIFIVQLAAFLEGMHVWLGWHWIPALIAGVLGAMFLGGLGTFAMSVIAFIGAWKGWEWQWWQAGLLCFPGLAVSLFAATAAGAVGILGKLTGPRASSY